MIAVLNTILSSILNLVFPESCTGCGTSSSPLCIACLSSSPIAERPTEKWIFPLYDYRHPTIKKALRQLKYKRKTRLAKNFAEVLYGKIMEELADLSLMENFNDAILVPIPLSKKGEKKRGYNQAELICRALMKIDTDQNSNKNFILENKVLVKSKETEHQARISNRTERLKNIVGSFAVTNKELIQKRNIILIDDITTTGATLSEARKMLKQAGARKVVAFVIAH